MQINKHNENVTVLENAVGGLSKILKIEVPDKKKFILKNGVILYLDLRDSNGDKLNGNAEVIIAGKRPTKIFPTDIHELSYLPYRNLSLKDQYNSENQRQLKIITQGEGVELLESHELQIWVQRADKVVDWDKSTIEFDIEEKAHRDN